MELFQPLPELPGAILMRRDVRESVEDVLEPGVRVHLGLHQGRGDNLPSCAPRLSKDFVKRTIDYGVTPAKRPPPPSCGFWSELAARSCLLWPDRASFGSLPQTGTKRSHSIQCKGNKNLQESPFLCQRLGPESGERRCVFPQNSFSNLNH